MTIVLLAVGISMPLCSYGRTPEGYMQGSKAFYGGDYLEAAKWLTVSARAEPSHLETRFKLARSYHQIFNQTGLQFEEAVAEYHVVLDLVESAGDVDQSIVFSTVYLAELYMRGGDYREALQYLNSFFEQHPEHESIDRAYNAAGVAHYYLYDYSNAVEYFGEALKHNPDNQYARFNQRSVFTRLTIYDQAMANIRLGRVDLAIEDLDHLIELAPRYGPALLQRATIYRDRGELDAAKVLIGKTLEYRVGDRIRFQLHDMLGDMEREMGDLNAALSNYRMCLRIFPGYMASVEKIKGIEQELSAATGDENDAPGDDEESEPAFDSGPKTSVGDFPL